MLDRTPPYGTGHRAAKFFNPAIIDIPIATFRGTPKGQTPSTRPDLNLKERWKRELDELLRTGDYGSENAAIQAMAEEYGVNRGTIYRATHPVQQERHKKMPSRAYEYEISHPSFSRERRNKQRNKNAWGRRNIEALVTEVYEREIPPRPLTLIEIADRLAEYFDVRMRPATIWGLNSKLAEDHEGMIIPTADTDPPRYTLNQKRYAGPKR